MSRKFDRPASSAFHVVTHVWGREYLDTFLDVCIPNQLSPGNVPALPAGSRYRILTNSAGARELDGHRMVRELRRAIPVDIIVVEAIDRHEGAIRGAELQIACHQRAIADILASDAAIIMLSADFVLSDGTLAAVARRHSEGYRAVVNTGLRLDREAFLEALAASHVALDAVTSRDLVRLAMPHLHPHTRSMFADASSFSILPVAVYWRVAEEGLVARCLHLHPLMVDPMIHAPLRGTNDGRYVFRVCPDFSRVHVVTDSDELQMFELTTATRQVRPSRGAGASAWRVAAVAAACDPHQVGYWREYTVRLHSGELGERWTTAANVAQHFAGKVLRLQPYAPLARRWFVFREHMRQRRERYHRAFRRGLPAITLKQALRPVRIAASRSTKVTQVLRKRTRRVLRRVAAR